MELHPGGCATKGATLSIFGAFILRKKSFPCPEVPVAANQWHRPPYFEHGSSGGEMNLNICQNYVNATPKLSSGTQSSHEF